MKNYNDQVSEMTKELQARYDDLFAKFKSTEYKGTSPKNEVSAVLDGVGRMKSISIDPNFDTTSKPLLEAMLFIAFNAACDAFNDGHAKYKKDCDQAYVDVMRDYTAKTLKEYAGLEQPALPELKWGAKKIDGEEN